MKFWKKMEGLGLFLSLLFLLTACGSKGNPTPTSSKQGLKIVTSFYPIYALVIRTKCGWSSQERASMTTNLLPRRWPRYMMRMSSSTIPKPWNPGRGG